MGKIKQVIIEGPSWRTNAIFLVLASKQESLPRAGRRVKSYQTNGEIETGPSYSGRGGGRIP
ncbi:unnamed protein product [Thlaspi arvense]|uniref:Uncharacterized protein n=1 Tax=Thlaspi arvense TaxID=13288 RepID=A0AAU9T6E3_THLAR|nr:unnamed protein product [Thlaspi arvense]